MNISTSAGLPVGYKFHLKRRQAYLEFFQWGQELPIFDDVISMLDIAEADLESEFYLDDPPIQQRRTWKYQTAHLVITNDLGADGLNHKALLEYLDGLRKFGFVHGFWNSEFDFYDKKFYLDLRGKGRLDGGPVIHREGTTMVKMG